MTKNVNIALAVLFLFLTGCATTAPTMPWARVRIENPDRLAMTLYRVEDDASVKVMMDLVTAAVVEWRLPFGAYWIDAGEARYPVPLLPKLAASLDVTIVRTSKSDRFSWIPDGWSVQGDTIGCGQEDERPAKLVHLRGFWMGKYEVTNAEYARFLNAVKTVDPKWINLESHKCMIKKEGDAFVTSAPNVPVVTVTWFGAKAYCHWTGSSRLPTEAEWEKAARGPESFLYAYGNVYTRNKANQESGHICEVGTFAPNGFGLHDMTGNVFEWVEDAYDRGPEPSEYRVLRGGSFVLDGVYLRNPFRMRYRPGVQADDIGFRVVREVLR